MKLLLYSHFFAPSIGGIETIVLSLARRLAGLRGPNGKARFDITVVTETPVENFDDRALPFRVVRQPGLVRLWTLIREAELVDVAGPAFWPLLLPLVARKKLVVEHHGFQAICPNGQLLIEPSGAPCPGHFMAGRHGQCFRCNSNSGWLSSVKLWAFTFIRRWLCQHAEQNVTPTVWLGELLKLPKTAPIPHGLEPLAAPGHPAKTPDVFVIAFQGRLVTAKGVRVLLEAARKLKEQGRKFQLVIIGGGPERNALEDTVRDADMSSCVHFAGRLRPAELEAALGLANVVVVPSLGGEVFGLVVAENMQRGLPVIASDIGAFTEVLGEEGLTFRTGDAEELSRRLARVMDDPSLATKLGHAGRRRALQLFDLDRMISAHAQLYQRVSSR
jgi:glycosyltransferase involved in cell wall biosynthesis